MCGVEAVPLQRTQKEASARRDSCRLGPVRIALLRGEALLLAHALRPRLLFIPENGARVLAWLDGLADGDGPAPQERGEEAALRSVFEAHGLLDTRGAVEEELEALAARVRQDRSHHTLHVCVSDATGRRARPKYVMRVLAERLDGLDDHAELEVVLFGPEGEVDWTLARRIGEGLLDCPDAREKEIQFSFRVSSASGAANEEAVRWAAERAVVVVVDGREENVQHIERLTRAGVRAPARVDVACTAPEDLPRLVERLVNANAAAGLVFARRAAARYPADEIADAVLDVQRRRPLPLGRMHPQNDWLERIELGQGLPWSCAAATGRVTAVGPDGVTAACPLLLNDGPAAGCRASASAEGRNNAPRQEAITRPLQTAIAHSVDDIPGCCDCEVRYICGGPCRVRANGCFFERRCLEDLIVETAKATAGVQANPKRTRVDAT